LIESYIHRNDVCFIGIDRPGYGRSSPLRRYKIIDLPALVEELTDFLEIKRFIALGYSGGGPFALACGALIPERISALGVVSGVGPAKIGSEGMHEANRKKFELAQRFPGIARFLLTKAFSSLQQRPENLEGQLSTIWQQMPEVDRETLEDKNYAAGILSVTKDAISQSVAGWVCEEILMTLPWSFELNEVKCKNVFLWHGGMDRNVPLSMGKAVAQHLPQCSAVIYPDEGHLSLLYNHGAEIINKLVQQYTR
jgi:pimeloyl-ACP methyl ester carboxylesterase